MNNAAPAVATEPEATLWDRLWAPCDVASVAFFRVAFALTVLAHLVLYFSNDLIEGYFGRPPSHMKFFGFEWVHTFDLDGMRRVYYLMALAAIGVGLGLLYRVSAILLFITFTYSIMAEAAQFQNHYYLMCLFAFLLILIPAHRSFSIDSILVPDKASCWIPGWCRYLLMFQVAIPYVYGGIAKLNGDWLHAMPVGIWISGSSHLPIIGPLLTERLTAWFVSYAGLLLDLFIVPLLLWRRTRIWAFSLVVAFHLSNMVLFDIDVFPFMATMCTTIFFSPGWPRRLLRLDGPESEVNIVPAVPIRTMSRRLTIGLVAVYLVWQVLFPFRHVLYPGSPSWTDEGQDFAWRMMLRRKDVFFRVYAKDGPSQRVVVVPAGRLLTPMQRYHTCVSPDKIVAIAPFFAEQARKQGLRDVEIRAVVLTSLNGRKPQLQLDPELDLLKMHRSIWPQTGITPLTERRREEAWDVPVSDWPRVLGIELPVKE
jgi:vitamin K-dependent gamma-carboxylase